MALTALEVKSISCPENKNQIKEFDGNGLFLLIKNNNSKLWRFRFKYAGKHQEMAFGKYPLISLNQARKMADEARLFLIQGINPMSERRERKRASNPEDRAFGIIALKCGSSAVTHGARTMQIGLDDGLLKILALSLACRSRALIRHISLN